MNKQTEDKIDFDLAYACYDGALPSALRMARYYGSPQAQRETMLHAMHQAHQKRCTDMLATICLWRCAPYDDAMRDAMLRPMQKALAGARHTAINIFSEQIV